MTHQGSALLLTEHHQGMLTLAGDGIIKNGEQRFIVHRHLLIHAGGFKAAEGELGIVDDGLQFVDDALVVIGGHGDSSFTVLNGRLISELCGTVGIPRIRCLRCTKIKWGYTLLRSILFIAITIQNDY